VVLLDEELQSKNRAGHTKQLLSLTTKQEVMKTNFKHVKLVLGIFLTALHIAFTSCSKDTVTPPVDEIGNPDNPMEPGDGEIESGEGIDLEEVEKDNGEIGLYINARDIVKKGYKASFADIMVTATTGNFNATDLIVDEFTNLARLQLEIDELAEEQEVELRDGVDILVTIKDESKNILESKPFTKTSFTDNPSELNMEGTGLDDLNDIVKFRNDKIYFIQLYDPDGKEIIGSPNNSPKANEMSGIEGILLTNISQIEYSKEEERFYGFFFEEIPGQPGVFGIGARDENRKLYTYIQTANSPNSSIGRLNTQTRKNHADNGGDTDITRESLSNYRFRIEKAGQGLYTITSLFNDQKIRYQPEIDQRFHATNTGTPSYFRIISLDIDWNLEELDTRFSKPILPPSSTSAAFNSTLRNCSSGELVQTVGQETTLTYTSTTAWEETMSVSTRDTYSVSATVSAEVEGSFFGNAATYGVEVSGGYEFSKDVTTINTISGGHSSSESITFSTERSITVPSLRATQVADLYQTYSNIKVPFVKRFRIRGDFQEDGSALNGDEILTLFNFNGFSGVITEIGLDYIEVTIRGTNTIENLFDTRTSADNVEPNCGG